MIMHEISEGEYEGTALKKSEYEIPNNNRDQIKFHFVHGFNNAKICYGRTRFIFLKLNCWFYYERPRNRKVD